MLGLLWTHRWQCAGLVFMQLAMLAIGMGGLELMGLAINVVHHQVDPSAADLDWPWHWAPPEIWSPLKLTSVLATAVLLLAAARSILNYLHAVSVASLVQHLVAELRSRVYEKLQCMSFSFYSRHGSGSIINRVTSDAQSVRAFVDGVILQMFVLALSLVVYLAYMLSIHVGLTLVCLATTPILWLLSATFSRRVRPVYDRQRDLLDNLLLLVSENVRGVQVVKGFAREHDEVARFRKANQEVQEQQQRIFWRVSLFTPSIEFLTSLNLVALLGYGGYLVIQGELPLGTGLIVFSGLLQQFSGQVSKVANIVNNLQQSLSAARRVFEVLDAPVEVHSRPNAQAVERLRGEVEFRQVSFGYRPGDPVLEDIQLRVLPGQCVAVLGATGAGKTSLLNLIPRFYDPTAGRVLLDGLDARDLELDSLRRNIGLVFQESVLFSGTVASNIAFGRPDATREQIERAARTAQAHDFIMELPNGYDTVLVEGGKDLSGGQRQRLAIARALLLEPPILLLDDPTAAVDPSTEREILRAMLQAMQGRTTFVVAHRLSTLRRADLVLVLEEGCIAELGTHDELMLRRGSYWKVAELQAEQEPAEPAAILDSEAYSSVDAEAVTSAR